jgi:hypothetical protein
MSDVQQALDRFRLASEADREQRIRELEDIAFVDKPETQWPEDIRSLRNGGTFGSVVVSSRPCLSLSQLNAPIDQVMSQARNARLAVQVNPKSGGASKATAETIQGLYRNIEVESRAQLARNWAFERAIKGGRGYYRVLKAYANDGDQDLDLIIARILNQHSVYLDPFHQEPDGSDAEWAFIVADLPFAKYKREFAKRKDGKPSELAGYDTEQLSSLGDDAPGWCNGDGEARTVRVAEYFTVVEGEQGQRSVKWQKINAVEVLDEEVWEGRYIPIVQVIGKEININGERRYVGIVGPAKDAQRSYNYMRSAEVEAIGLAPKAPWLIMEGQIEGFEKEWQQANLRNLPYLTYRSKNLGGSYAPAPARNVAEPAIQALTIASRQAKDDLQSITGQFNEAQGKGAGAQQSGRAIQALQQQSDEGTSGYLDNLANVSMTHEARIVLDLMPHIYNRPGRVVKILEGDDDQASNVMLNQPFTRSEHSEQPQPAPPGTPPQQIEHYQLSPDDRYSCTVSIGKSYTTKMEQANAMFGELSQAVPQLVPLFAGPWVRQMNLPGSEEIADRFDRSLPPGIATKEGEQTDPRVAQQQMQQMQQQMQAMQAALQEAQSGIQAKALEVQSKEKIAAAELALKAQIADQQAELDRLKEQNRLAIETAKIQAGQAETAAKLNADAERDQRQQAHDRDVMQHQQAHETQARHEQHAHEAASSEVDLHHQTGMAHLSHVHAQEQAASQPSAK